MRSAQSDGGQAEGIFHFRNANNIRPKPVRGYFSRTANAPRETAFSDMLPSSTDDLATEWRIAPSTSEPYCSITSFDRLVWPASAGFFSLGAPRLQLSMLAPG
jgi:hypothetical protein